MRAAHTHWRPDELQALREAARSGLTARETAARLGTTTEAVQSRARRPVRLGRVGRWGRVRFRGGRRGWTPAVDRQLRTLIAEGASRSEAAAELEMSASKVSRRAARLGLRFPPGFRADPARLSRVVGLVIRGTDTAGKLAGVLGVSREAANKTAARLVGSGVLRRTGAGRGRRLVVTRQWKQGD